MHPTRFFLVERDRETLILTPTTNLGEIQDLQSGFEKKQILRLLEDYGVKNVVVAFYAIEFLGRAALTLLVNLIETVTTRGGRILFCNVSDHVGEILEAANLKDYWLTVDSLEEAIQEVGGFQVAV